MTTKPLGRWSRISSGQVTYYKIGRQVVGEVRANLRGATEASTAT